MAEVASGFVVWVQLHTEDAEIGGVEGLLATVSQGASSCGNPQQERPWLITGHSAPASKHEKTLQFHPSEDPSPWPNLAAPLVKHRLPN